MQETNMIAKAEFSEEQQALAMPQASALGNVAQSVFVGKTPESDEDKMAVFNALNDAQSIWDVLDENAALEIRCVNVIAHNNELADMETGEVQGKVRIVFADEDGGAYATSSEAVFSTVQQIFAMFGTPDKWAAPLTIKPYRRKSASGRPYLAIRVSAVR